MSARIHVDTLSIGERAMVTRLVDLGLAADSEGRSIGDRVADYWNLAARWETIANVTTGDLSQYARRQVTYWNNAATYGELAA